MIPSESHATQPAAEIPLAWREYGLILVQMAALAVLVRQFHLEATHFLPYALLLVTGGFAVHAVLPVWYRLPWFFGLCLGTLVLVLGPQQAANAVVVGAALITTAMLPVRFSLRVGGVLLLGSLLIWLRAGSAEMFWPVIGSMFMFRLIVYLFSVRRHREPVRLIHTLSYFFLLPNIFFPLFPVVDYQTFCTTYYNDRRLHIYQTGVHWMVVGVGHLLLYRFIKSQWLPAPLEIRTGSQLGLFLAMNYGLYLRVSGLFHIICGILHLFGFHLPRTHNCYFLASSFSDVWRRINVYWKDFMERCFFAPVFFRLRRHGLRWAVTLAVMWVFGWTWLAHSWQVFWLMGEFPFAVHEALLWMCLTPLVAASALGDARRLSRPGGMTRQFSLTGAAIHSLKVAAVFACVSVFWAKWSLRPDLFNALMVPGFLVTVDSQDVAILCGVIGSAVVIGTLVQLVRRRLDEAAAENLFIGTLTGRHPLSFDRSVGCHLLPMMGLLVLALPPIQQRLGARGSKILATLTVEPVTPGDAMTVVRGYYEQLNEGAVQASPFLGDPRPPRQSRIYRFGDMTITRPDLLEMELIPGWIGSYAGGSITVNRWGMRDRDRTLRKPPGGFRIALVGSSVIMGAGVNDHQTLSRVLEDRLREDGLFGKGPVEVLNFGMGAFSPIHRRALIQRKVLSFSPDLVVYFAHQDEVNGSIQRLGTAIFRQIDLEDPCLEAVVENMRLPPATPEPVVYAIIGDHLEAILQCTYQAIAATCHSADIPVLYVYLPMPTDPPVPFDPTTMLELASSAGFETTDLSGWRDGRSADDVLVNQQDHHPNALGHRLLAAALENALRNHPHLIESPRGDP